MSADPSCPCDRFVHPQVITNPAGLSEIRYRVGDYGSFRRALLRARDGEIALADWHPVPGEDLALQLLEWWAYLADVLTFYNERAMQEALLRTALMPEDVRRIIRLIGYRPRPGIGATGVVAALTRTPRPFVVPRGFAVEGRARSGEPPQVFEVDEDVPIGTLGRRLLASARLPALPTGAGTAPTPTDARGFLIDAVAAHEKVSNRLPKITAGGLVTLYLGGVASGLKPGDLLVVIRKDWDGIPYPGSDKDAAKVLSLDPGPPRIFDKPVNIGPTQFSLLKVKAVAPIYDGKGRPSTQLDLLSAHDLDPDALRREYRLMRPTKLAHLWLYHVRYSSTSTTDPAALLAAGLNNALNVAQKVLDPLGLFGGGGPPPPPPQDPRVLTNAVATDPPPPHGAAHLEAITRGIKAGDPVLFEQEMPGDAASGGAPGSPNIFQGLPSLPGGAGIAGLFQQIESVARSALNGLFPQQPQQAQALANSRAQVAQLVKVTGYSEEIWYANAPQPDQIGRGPPVGPPGQSAGGGGILSKATGGLFGGGGGGEAPIPIPHSKITFMPNPFIGAMADAGNQALQSIVVHYAFQEVGELVPPPPGPVTEVDVPADASFKPGVVIPALIEARTGTAGTTGVLGTTATVTGEPLVPPLRALLNLLPISRGQTVDAEILGAGDPTVAGQEFMLRRAPLTYLPDTGPGSTNGYRSTLRIRVDGIEWSEVPSFYRQEPNARVFVTREDEQQKTHVRFGDGENGARLPAGNDNVVARYRVGSGAVVPPAGTLTSILKPLPGLQAIRNPVAVGGGADPDPPGQIRRYAPRSVLTFGRAISGDDYETVAAQTPGVRRARVYWSWDGPSQRTVVKVFVGDDAAAVAAATATLRALTDPNRPAVVALAAPIYPDLSLSVEVDPAFDPDAVAAAVRAALQDPQRQPFGNDVVQIGQTVYNSHVYDVCLGVPGVIALRGLQFRFLVTGLGPHGTFSKWVVEPGERHSPGDGGFYLLREDLLHITAEVARHGG